MARLLTLRRNLARLLTRDEVDDNFVNVASDFSGAVDPATLPDAYVAPYMRWADTGTGWLKRRNSANDGWVPEQRLLRRTVQPFNTSELPTADGGPIYVNGQGMAEFDAAAGMYRVKSPVPVGAVAWWPLRSSVPTGRIPADGQTISRATFPDLAAMVAAGTVPVVSDADWLADPLKRGSYTAGDGTTTIRVPDYNGKSAGSIGAPFMRGDGLLANGALKASQNKAHQHSFQSPQYLNGESGGTNSFLGTSSSITPIFTRQTAGEGGAEAHPTFVSGVWTIQAFGAIVNSGSLDVAQLASDLATLNAAFQTQLAFAIIYPNGGTEAAPAPVAVNTRYVLANPFPGSYVICEAQLKYTDGWSSTGWFTQQSTSYGARASQLDRGDIVVRTGVTGVTASPDGAGQATAGTLLSPVQSRVLVWKCKG